MGDRTTITVQHQLIQGTASFSFPIVLSFMPDTFIVRQIVYGNCEHDPNISAVQTNIVRNGDGIIGIVYPNTDAEEGPPVVVNTPIAMSISNNAEFYAQPSTTSSSSAAIFRLVTLSNGERDIPNELADGQLFIVLEFIKYDDKV